MQKNKSIIVEMIERETTLCWVKPVYESYLQDVSWSPI